MANGDNFNDTVANGILGAVNILTKKALSDLKFDKTYSPCTIISRSESDKNVYICEYENARFEAYSEQSFFPDELVQVLVPQNNWDNQKRIISRVMTGNSAAYNFKYPFDDFVVVSALEVEDLYTLIAGCAPVFISDLAAIEREDVRLFLTDYYRYLQNQDKEYVWGTTPFEIETQTHLLNDKKREEIQKKGNLLTAFPSKQIIYDLLLPEDELLQNALQDDVEHSFYDYNDLMNLIGDIGDKLKKGWDKYSAYITARNLITSNEALTDDERVQRLFVFDQQYTDDVIYFPYHTYEEIVQRLEYLATDQKTLSNLQTEQYSLWLGLTIDDADQRIASQEALVTELLSYWPAGTVYTLQQLVNRGVPPSITTQDVYDIYEAKLLEAQEQLKTPYIYYYVENNELKTMYNQQTENRLVTDFIIDLTNTWIALNTKIFDWTLLSRDVSYEDMITTMIDNSLQSKEILETYINAWMAYKTKAFRGRTFEETYLEYRITPICGGYDADYKFWANRRFEDKLTGHFDKMYTKLCSFVPRHDAATIEGFTKAGLQLDISSYLNNFNIIKGEYGVKILVEGIKKTADTSSNESLTTVQYQKKYSDLQTQYESAKTRLKEESSDENGVIKDGYAYQKALMQLEARYEPLFAKLEANLVDTESTDYGVLNTDIGMVFDDEFTSKDFYGNAYAYTVSYSQQKLLNIEDYVSISRISLYVWQSFNTYDANNNLVLGWERNDGTTVPFKYTSPMANSTLQTLIYNTENDDVNLEYESVLPQNLIFAKPYLGLGFAVAELANGKLILYTEDPLEYGVDGVDADVSKETRTLKAIWVKAETDGSINIYPSWEAGEDGELIELQPYERALFYTRDSSNIYTQLVDYYKELYNIPFDSTRAKKQKYIIDMIARWINYERVALQRERNELYAHINEERNKIEIIPYQIDQLNKTIESLNTELATVQSIADMSLLTNTALYTQRDIDNARLELSTILSKIVDLDKDDALTLEHIKWFEEVFVKNLYERTDPATINFKQLTETQFQENFISWLPAAYNPEDPNAFLVGQFYENEENPSEGLDSETQELLIGMVWTYYRLYAKTIELQEAAQKPPVTPETAPDTGRELVSEVKKNQILYIQLPKFLQQIMTHDECRRLVREALYKADGAFQRGEIVWRWD